ncbi:uncharacterized protein Dmoj_GI26203 [Drosophila mojavensis]|uniref:Retrotransposon gag domain-containing protein n=1 Tax=Drosophila mojavensis TaxID=7230 RepID=A0A0Q9XH33_DROMO|nr:uncharacterized protein Dmoj_GI26203 [Drosophila mojavensis]
MAKLQFGFEFVADEDQKSHIILIKSITDDDGKKYSIPQNYQSCKAHPYELMKLPEFRNVAKSLQKRGQFRNVWMKLSDEILQLYRDGSGNMIINNYLLQDISGMEQSKANTSADQIDTTLIRLLEKLCESESMKDCKSTNLNRACDKFVLDRFEGKKMNSNQWLQTYESECNRLGISKDVEKIEALRLFLDEAAEEWFNSMLIKHTISSEWVTWKEHFLQTFADRGWSSVTYALNYKYISGSLLDYALKKERLLLETDKNMNNITLVNLIVHGLPKFIRNKIDRQNVTAPVALFSELRKFEDIIETKYVKANENRFKTFKTEMKPKFKQPCKICEGRGNKNRYHPVDMCWFNVRENKSTESNKRINSVLEIDTTEDPKN